MGGGDCVATNDGSESNTSFAAADCGDGAGVTVNIRMSNGSKFSVKVSLDSTVEPFKSIIAQNCDIPAGLQKLIYKGRILKNDQTLQSYGLDADHTVHLVRGFSPAASNNPSSATNAGGANTTPSLGRDVSSNEGGAFGQAGLGASLFPGVGLNGLGSDAGLFGAGLPELEQVQQQLTQNPNLMRDILNMPFVQNLMNNPNVIRNMMMSNPQMRELIDRNPELAHIMNDPAILRQTMEAAQNPEIMREMMRNTDRAMSNIESSPEGFNMLRRMYENVQEPFLNVTTMTGDSRNDLSSNPFAALVGGQVGGPGRNQAVNPTITNSETAANCPAPNTNPLPNPWASADTGGAQTNIATRSNATGDATPPPFAELGSPDFGQMLGSMPDANSLSQLMQNPALSQMMQNIFSNPQQMNQIFGLNSSLHNLTESNPQLREMLQNPDLIRQLTSPVTFQQLLNFQQVMSQLGRTQLTREPGQNVSGVQGAPDNMGLEMLMNMFSSLGTEALTVPNRSNAPPEELYATQLSQLQEMGFYDTQENIRALMATAGNVHAAVERLLGNQG